MEELNEKHLEKLVGCGWERRRMSQNYSKAFRVRPCMEQLMTAYSIGLTSVAILCDKRFSSSSVKLLWSEFSFLSLKMMPGKH